MITSFLLKTTIGLSALSLSLPSVVGIDVVGRVAWNAVLPDISRLPTDSKVVLRSGSSVEEFIRQDGTFILQDVKPGKYVLTVRCRTVAFPSLSIEVPFSQDGLNGQIPIVKPHIFGQAPLPPPESGMPPRPEPRLQYPIQLVPTGKIEYENIKVGFNPIAMLLGNPMYLLMGGMAVLMMVMPKLLALMDPEALAEVHANQANLHQQISSIKNMDLTSSFAQILASSNEDDTNGQTPPSSKASTKSAPKANDSSNAKRRK